MCGRFLLDSEIRDILERYNIDDNELFNYNKGEIFPSNSVPVVYYVDKKAVGMFKWGFAFKNRSGSLINSRAETITEKPAFKESFANRRCLIPVNAFYEWKNENGKKMKHIAKIDDENLISLGGIYKTFIDENNNMYNGFSIITVEANKQMSEIHDRMPLIIDKDFEDKWLLDTDITELMDIIKKARGEKLIISPVFNNNFEQIGFF